MEGSFTLDPIMAVENRGPPIALFSDEIGIQLLEPNYGSQGIRMSTGGSRFRLNGSLRSTALTEDVAEVLTYDIKNG